MIKKAVIFAGGYGTRMLPVTKSVPKELLPIINIPTIEYAIKECVKSGITDICIVTNESKNSLIDFLSYNSSVDRKLKNSVKDYTYSEKLLSKVKFTFLRQGKRRGTAKALECCENFVGKEPFCVLFPDEIFFSDVPAIQQLISVYYECLKPIVGCVSVPENQTSSYGVIKYSSFNKNLYKINSIVEKPSSNPPSSLASCGRFVFDKEIFQLLNNLKMHNDEYYIPDAINFLAENNDVYAYEITAERFDTGNKEDYVKSIIYAGLIDKDISYGIKKFIMEKLDNIQP